LLLFYLALALDEPVRSVGVDILPLMVHTARALAASVGLADERDEGAADCDEPPLVRFVQADAAALAGSMLQTTGLVLLSSFAWDEALRARVYARLLAHLPHGALLVDYAAAPAALVARRLVVPIGVGAAALGAAAAGGAGAVARVRRRDEARWIEREASAATLRTSWAPEAQRMHFARVCVEVVDSQ
jgi:hypothetical protein